MQYNLVGLIPGSTAFRSLSFPDFLPLSYWSPFHFATHRFYALSVVALTLIFDRLLDTFSTGGHNAGVGC